MSATASWEMLAATPYLETTLILFLHILAAMATMGGALGVLVLWVRARGATNMGELRASLGALATFNRAVLQPAAGLVGVIGLLLALRYDQRSIFAFSRQGWLIASIVLWIVLQVVAGMGVASAVRADEGVEADGLATAKARLGSGTTAALIWLTLAIVVAIVYLMVFQPFVRR
jgi:uncharacterized membrane protein